MTSKKINYIYVAGSGRSGTTCLAKTIEHYSTDTFVTHEPVLKNHYHDICYVFHDNKKKLLEFMQKKIEETQELMEQQPRDVVNYVESNHFWLKCWHEASVQLIPDLSVIHIARHPLYVSKSFVIRGHWPGNTGNWLGKRGPTAEDIFSLPLVSPNHLIKLSTRWFDTFSPLQKNLWQWFEMEARYQKLVSENKLKKAFEITTEDLNNKNTVMSMFKYLGIKHKKIQKSRRLRNMNWRQPNSHPTKITRDDKREYAAFVEILKDFVDISLFDKEIYRRLKIFDYSIIRI